MQFIEYPDRDLAAIGLADKLSSALKNALLGGDSVTLAVPGGTTPGPVFDSLGAAQLEWSRVTVLLTDERWVPEDHPRSNAGLVRERLLQGPAAQARFIPFHRSGMTAQEAAPHLSAELAPHLPLSVVLLGMGADMHTASLFPGAQGVSAAMAADAPAVCVVSPADQPETRITLSAPVLNAASQKHLVIYGDEKRMALEEAATCAPEEAPISAVVQGGVVHWAP